jgi:hypothetical protein
MFKEIGAHPPLIWARYDFPSYLRDGLSHCPLVGALSRKKKFGQLAGEELRRAGKFNQQEPGPASTQDLPTPVLFRVQRVFQPNLAKGRGRGREAVAVSVVRKKAPRFDM